MCLPTGCLPGGVSAGGGGVCLGGVCPGGVCLGGCLPRECTPPPRGQTDTCENITFPQLLLWTVKSYMSEQHSVKQKSDTPEISGSNPLHGGDYVQYIL